MSARRRLATDHRALVLASVATHPAPTSATVVRDCCTAFAEPLVRSMLSQLRREGLIARDPGDEALEITPEGLAWLRDGRFDRAVPAPGIPRPGARTASSDLDFAPWKPSRPSVPGTSTFWKDTT